MRNKVRFIIGILFFVGLAILLITYFFKLKPQVLLPKIIETVPVNKVQAVVNQNLVNFESWKSPVVDQIYKMYDLNNNVTAYLYTIKDSYGKAGYIVISANTRHAPIIEISKSTESPYSILSVLTVALTENTERSYSNVRTQLIYLGSTSYYGKLSFREGETVVDKYYKLSSGSPSEIAVKELQEQLNTYVNTQDDGAAEAWERIK